MDKNNTDAAASTIKLATIQATATVERTVIENGNIHIRDANNRNEILPVKNSSNLYSNPQGSNEPSNGLKNKVFKLKSSLNLELEAPCEKKVATDPVSSAAKHPQQPESKSEPEPAPGPVPQDPTFSCHLCPSEKSKTFIDRLSLNKHLRIIHNQELSLDIIYCYSCFKEFQNEFHYTQHCQTVHSNSYKVQTETETPNDSQNNNIAAAAAHSCRYCPYTFTTMKNLNEHLQFSKKCRQSLFKKCDKCPEASPNFFISKYQLQKHVIQVHPESRKKRIRNQSTILLSCGVCPQTFIDQSTRATHIHMIHDEEDLSRLRCDICSSQFDRRLALKNHLKWEHSRNFLCDVCSKSFGNQALFTEHNTNKASVNKDEDGTGGKGKSALKSKKESDTTGSFPDFICQICDEKCESACQLNVHTDNHLKDLRVQAGSSLFPCKKRKNY